MPLQDADAETLIRLSHVGMVLGRRRVLDNASLTVHRGDFMAVTGPNGGGKTTLMRLILGLLKPTCGTVTRCRADITIGYLPQKSRIDTGYPITVTEVIESGLLARRGLGGTERREKVAEAMELVELTDHADKPIGALSGGQQQRALLARAIISRPEILVLDEPLSYIDKQFEQKIYNIVRDLHRTTTILLVSHEITNIASMANRHIIVDGAITECGSAHHFARIALCR